MKRTLLVPVDFTPVTHNGLHYACELSKVFPSEIVAVHLLEKSLITDLEEQSSGNVAMRKMVERLYNEIMAKTTSDLNNFVSDLKAEYGDIIQPVIQHGSIYEAFNDVAAQYESSLIVMGTHGITGMQHVLGSRAYKVVANTPLPFLIVQKRHYAPINTVYFAFHNKQQFLQCAGQISVLSEYFPGNFIMNVIAEEVTEIPAVLQALGSRVRMTHRVLRHEDILDQAISSGADAVGIVIDEVDNLDSEIYGMTQDKILANKDLLPVICLPCPKN